MTIFTGLMVFVIIWWLVLFTVLPWGIRQPEPEEMEPGQMSGAPQRPKLGLKLAVTTAIALVLWGIAYYVISADLISFREMAQ